MGKGKREGKSGGPEVRENFPSWLYLQKKLEEGNKLEKNGNGKEIKVA